MKRLLDDELPKLRFLICLNDWEKGFVIFKLLKALTDFDDFLHFLYIAGARQTVVIIPAVEVRVVYNRSPWGRQGNHICQADQYGSP